MFSLLIIILQEVRATQPQYFFPVALIFLGLGGIGWLIAAVLGFARARAFGPSARWFSYGAVCMLLYHLHFVVFGVMVLIATTQNSPDVGGALGFGAFFNIFVVLAALCAIMGFIRLTNPR
jgi:succinate-acetate transporter protein